MAIVMRRASNIEYKKKNRWMISIEGLEFGETPLWIVQAAGRPRMTINSIETPYLNVSQFSAGKGVWEPIDIRFVDPIVQSSSQYIMNWVLECVEHASGIQGYASTYKKTVTIQMLGPDGTTKEHWTLYGAYPENANFGDLDMGSDELADVSVTIRYDYAELNY